MLTVNAQHNTVTVVPNEHMAHDESNNATDTTMAVQSEGSTSRKSTPKYKVPRPPNAFIIYRKEWHPKVVQENVSSTLAGFGGTTQLTCQQPGLHNNDVSIIIGRKWKSESEAVKEYYKRVSTFSCNRNGL